MKKEAITSKDKAIFICIECDKDMIKCPQALKFIRAQVLRAVKDLASIASHKLEVILHSNRVIQVKFTGSLEDFEAILTSECVAQATTSNYEKLTEALLKYSKVYNMKR